MLEPWYSFVLEVPSDQVGRAMSDIGQMNGSFEGPEAEDKQGMVRLTGTAPASEMRDYQREVWAYTKGRGRITFTLKGYEPCHNAEEVIEQIGMTVREILIIHRFCFLRTWCWISCKMGRSTGIYAYKRRFFIRRI